VQVFEIGIDKFRAYFRARSQLSDKLCGSVRIDIQENDTAALANKILHNCTPDTRRTTSHQHRSAIESGKFGK